MFEKIEEWKQEYIIVKHIFLDLKDYPNMNMRFPIGIFLIFMVVALIAVCFIINKRKNDIALICKQLVRRGAVDEKNAKTLKELRLDGVGTLKRAIARRSGRLSSLVVIAGREKLSYEDYSKLSAEKRREYDKINIDEVKIYLAESEIKAAEKITAEGVSPIWKPIVLSVIVLVIFAVLFIVMPDILEVLNSWLAP